MEVVMITMVELCEVTHIKVFEGRKALHLEVTPSDDKDFGMMTKIQIMN